MEEVKSKVAEFKINVPYSWDPNALVTLDGGSFGYLLQKALKREQEIIAELEGINILKNKLVEMVETGVAVGKVTTSSETL